VLHNAADGKFGLGQGAARSGLVIQVVDPRNDCRPAVVQTFDEARALIVRPKPGPRIMKVWNGYMIRRSAVE
jgi:hypothetical protein